MFPYYSSRSPGAPEDRERASFQHDHEMLDALIFISRRARSLHAPALDVVVSIRGCVPVAVRRAHVERVIVPPAAAQDSLVRPAPRLRILHSAQAFYGKQKH